ncbi:hypothetical protein C8R46DRAFT_1027946 [Mycena filopes]|nr:hypothetical protein C8R46DRAFT_1027946 [Mycena filopes]
MFCEIDFEARAVQPAGAKRRAILSDLWSYIHNSGGRIGEVLLSEITSLPGESKYLNGEEVAIGRTSPREGRRTHLTERVHGGRGGCRIHMTGAASGSVPTLQSPFPGLRVLLATAAASSGLPRASEPRPKQSVLKPLENPQFKGEKTTYRIIPSTVEAGRCWASGIEKLRFKRLERLFRTRAKLAAGAGLRSARARASRAWTNANRNMSQGWRRAEVLGRNAGLEEGTTRVLSTALVSRCKSTEGGTEDAEDKDVEGGRD